MPGDQINYETQQPTGEVTETIKCFSTNWKNKDTPPPPYTGMLENLMLSNDTSTAFLLQTAKGSLGSDQAF